MKIFFGILGFFLIFGWLAILFSAIGLFYTGTLVLSIIASLVFTIYFNPRITHSLSQKTDKSIYFIALISLLISLATCYFATPTIFGGRDQGAIASAAIELSKNHALEIESPIAQDLFQKYGPGRALNFPGFDYTIGGDLISRFPVGYTAYLASAYGLAGLKGIQYANFVPLFLFLVIFWIILKECFSNKIALLGFFLAVTFFPFLWFAKYALTEIYMLFLVWAGIYFLIKFRDHIQAGGSTSIREVEPPFLYLALAAFGLSALTRIEGIIFFFLALAYTLLLEKRKTIAFPKNFKKYLFASTLALFGLYVYLNFPVLTDSLKNLARAFLGDPTKESRPSAELYPYLARIFVSYNVIAYLALGFAGILWLLKNFKKNWTKPEFLVLFLTFPAFFYLLTPQITLDDPWLLRRFVFAVFPALIFFSIYFLQKFFYHKMFLYLTLVILIAANCVVTWRFFTISENKELLPQIERISERFGPNDLILVDRLTTGSGFSLMSEPLRTIYGKNAVYFFNAKDLQFIDQDRYENIYLLTPLMSEEQNPWYAGLVAGKTPVDSQIITNNFLEPSDKKFGLSVNVEAETFTVVWKIK